eukprot:gnl/MRDRNA2_/MRDRNA2_108080_c0_seq1.p1 gnl/MRDRNA2_/MRDRNA2_108080_c0~~gnl/MRDRNA2_/MRDRNA2_108080_c0_seq1.p1  ORF type:complete len:271 (+),score=25.30 gnl/MRDRNA2_/MRDRNA2_108080_c0_seq1:70-882(+)
MLQATRHLLRIQWPKISSNTRCSGSSTPALATDFVSFKSSLTPLLSMDGSSFHLKQTPLKYGSAGDAFILDGCLSPNECDGLIQAAEELGFEQAGIDPRAKRTSQDQEVAILRTDIRNNERIVMDDPEFASALFARCSAGFPSEFRGGLRVHSFSSRIRFYKYGPGHFFSPHTDGAFHDRQSGTRLVFTVLLYLNGVAEGGCTNFYSGFRDPKLKPSAGLFDESNLLPSGVSPVKPSCGRALAFYHKAIHKGEEVKSGVKYVLRLDALYR